jgi:serine/threonine-protein kinase
MAYMIGETLRGYRVVEQLGSGGMGMVFVGEHEFIGKRAAIKVLLPELSQDSSIVRRFFNEAKAATQVRHPGIVEVFDFGYHTDGRAFIIMELLQGESLASRLRRIGRVPNVVCMRLLSQIGGALGAAHAVGIVHRDLKPDNIFVVRDPDITGGERAKVLDFGIAKLAGDMSAEALKTRTGSIIGTPRYMAPEQCRGSQVVDHRADLYALGCIAYEMLCGQPPFIEQGIGDLFAAHMFRAPQPPSTIEPSISPAIESAILCLLAKNPDERFPTAEAFVKALNSADAGNASSKPAPIVDGTWPGQTRQSTTLNESVAIVRKTVPAGSRRSRWPWSVALGFAIIGGASAAFVLDKKEPIASRDVHSTQAKPDAEATSQEFMSIAAPTNVAEASGGEYGQLEQGTPGGSTTAELPGSNEPPVQPAQAKPTAGNATVTPAMGMATKQSAEAWRAAPKIPKAQENTQREPNAGASDSGGRSAPIKTTVTSPPPVSNGGSLDGKSNSTLPEYPDRDAVADAVSDVRDRVAACSQKHPGSGEVRLTVVIEPRGSVATAWLNTTPNALLGRCVVEVVKQAKFPPSQQGAQFTYPFVFGGGSNPGRERLNRADIVDVISAVRPRILECGKENPGSGAIKLAIEVEPSGSVGEISVQAAASNDLLSKCVVAVMKQVKFPASQKGGTFAYPFVF